MRHQSGTIGGKFIFGTGLYLLHRHNTWVGLDFYYYQNVNWFFVTEIQFCRCSSSWSKDGCRIAVLASGWRWEFGSKDEDG
jgi:hypothetical protein